MTVPQRVFIVEDEVLVGMVLEDMLDMLGHKVVANCANLPDADGIVSAGDYDLAIIDVHVGGDPVFPLADRILAAGKPLIFATGSSSGSLPERFRNERVLEKPYALTAVEAAVAALVTV